MYPLHGDEVHGAPIGWEVAPVPLTGLLVGLALYALLVAAAARRGTPVPRGRVVAFAAGLAVVAVALFSPLDPVGEQESAAVHMVQHELLLMVAPLLLVAGLHQRVMLPVTRIVMRGLAVDGWRRLLAFISSPWAAAAAWAAVTIGWHLPAAYGLSLAHPGVHVLEHLSLLLAGCWFWSAVVGRLPAVHHATSTERAGALGVAMAAGGLVGAVLIWWPTLLYPGYADSHGWFGIGPLADQRAAGLLMMAIDMPLLLGALLVGVAAAWRDGPRLAAAASGPGRG